MQNLVNLSKHVNWIDILVFLVFLRVIFVSLKNGLSSEFFKVVGTFSAAMIALHRYPSFAGYLAMRSARDQSAGAFFYFLSFVSIAGAVYAVFWLARLLFARYADVTIEASLNRWMGLVAGLARAFLLSSIILCALLLSDIQYFKRSVMFSYTGSYCAAVAPTTYAWFFKSIVSKLLPGQKYNTAFEAVTERAPNRKK